MLNVAKADNTIELTRGDTGYLEVVLRDEEENIYSLKDGEKLSLKVKSSIYENEPVIEKEITESNIFYLRPEDTKSLDFGEYVYDIEVVTAEGDVFTVINTALFVLLSEV